MTYPQKSYDEIVDLFARTNSAEILAFRPSTDSQQRMRYLLEQNESGELTDVEAGELERFGELEHLMQLVKARAQVYISEPVRSADDENSPAIHRWDLRRP